MKIYQPSFFDESKRLAALSRLRDPLEDLGKHIDFEMFRGVFGLMPYESQIAKATPPENLEHSQPSPNLLLLKQKGGADLAPNAWRNHDSKTNPITPFLDSAR